MALTMVAPDPTLDPDHLPVLADEVIEVFRDAPSGLLIDLTLGLGGHAGLILAANPRLRLLGIDQDVEALERAARNLAPFGDRVKLMHARSDDVADIVEEEGIDDVTAILADLGVSSIQIDQARRGFSYRVELDGPLDMRMNQDHGPTAAEVLAELDEDTLARHLRILGDEPHARRVARAVIDASPRTTGELSRAIRAAVPALRVRSGDPSKRTFQVLRILVNDEIGTLERTLDRALSVLRPGGRFGVISFHSTEDRMVKLKFRSEAEGACTCPVGLPCICGATPTVRLLRRKPWVASEAELSINSRAASARFRAVEALPVLPFQTMRSL